MPFPIHARFWLPADVRRAADDFDAQLGGFLTTEHKDDGTHGAITADSLAVAGASALHAVTVTTLTATTLTVTTLTATTGTVTTLTSTTAIVAQLNASQIQPDRSTTAIAGDDVAVTGVVFATGGGNVTGFSITTGMLTIINKEAASTLTLQNQNGGSLAANRMICPSGVDLVLQPGQGVMLFYDEASSRWRIAGA